MKSGIYFYKNEINNKMYVGQSRDIQKRIYVHNFRLSKGIDDSIRLQNSVIKYGLSNFSWGVLEFCSESELDNKEIYWIEHLNTLSPRGYNLRNGGSYGKHSKETKQQIRDSTKGNLNHFYGKNHTISTKNRMSSMKVGKKQKKSTSKYFGVCKTRNNNWQVQIRYNSVSKYLGTYSDEKIAAKIYDEYVINNQIPVALNFNNDQEGNNF